MGLAGLGDLVLTCTGNLSRNRRVGLALAEGTRAAGRSSPTSATSPKACRRRAPRVRSPRITASRCRFARPSTACLHEGLPPRQAVLELLRREPRASSNQA